jgi:hypothetical protein
VKQNELWFQEMVVILSPLGLYRGNRKTKLPLLDNYDTCPSRVNLEVFVFAPSDGCLVTTNLLASTQALRSRRMSSASKSSDCVVAHRSNRYPPVRPVRPVPTGQTRQTHRSDWSDAAAPPSLVFALWINQGTQWFSGEPPKAPRTRCSLRQSLLMTRLPRNPDSKLVLRSTKKSSMTSSCHSHHHATHT